MTLNAEQHQLPRDQVDTLLEFRGEGTVSYIHGLGVQVTQNGASLEMFGLQVWDHLLFS